MKELTQLEISQVNGGATFGYINLALGGGLVLHLMFLLIKLGVRK